MLSLALFLLFSLPPQTASTQRGADLPLHPRRLLVKSAPGLVDLQRREALARLGARELRHMPQIDWSVIEVAEGTLHQSRWLLERDARFVEVCYDRARKLAYTPNDPYWPGMWHMMQIDADDAWNTIKGSPSVRVAIMDTGVEVTHPDLAANVWVNPGEIPNNLLDDDGNGYVDDVNGYDFAYDDPFPDDVNGHGTSCAGIVAAVQDNSLGVTGVAPLCEVVAVKAAQDNGYFFDGDVVPALLYCADMGFQVISMSFFTDFAVLPAEHDAIRYCWNNGVLPVAAAGNSNSVFPYYPGSYEEVLGVGATQDTADTRAYFSNYGSWVDVAAPGVSLSTTAILGTYTTGFGGTSGATPHVAGLAALLFSADPSATNARVRAAIEDTAVLLDEYPVGQWTSYGRIDADAAVARVRGLTSGSVPARPIFIAPCGGKMLAPQRSDAGTSSKGKLGTRVFVHGVGFEKPNTVRFLRDGTPLPLALQKRSVAAAWLPSVQNGSILKFEVNGATLGLLVWDLEDGLVFSATDAGTDLGSGSVAQGGFSHLYRNDGIKFTCTRSSAGQIYVEFAVRRVVVPNLSQIVVQFSRSYIDCIGAGETLEIYDWSTSSYPYGSWVLFGTRTITSSANENLQYSIPGPDSRFVDLTGTIYIRLTTTGAGSAGKLEVDRMRLVVQ